MLIMSGLVWKKVGGSGIGVVLKRKGSLGEAATLPIMEGILDLRQSMSLCSCCRCRNSK